MASPRGALPESAVVKDLDNAPCTERGGFDGAILDLGADAGTFVALLNAELTG